MNDDVAESLGRLSLATHGHRQIDAVYVSRAKLYRHQTYDGK